MPEQPDINSASPLLLDPIEEEARRLGDDVGEIQDSLPSSPELDPVEEEARMLGDEVVEETSLSEKVGLAAARGTGAFIESGSLLSGALAGGRIGSLGFAAGPVVGTTTTATGAIAGGIAGMLFGGEVNRLMEPTGLAVGSLDRLPPDVRTFGVMAEIMGGSLPFMGAPILAARFGKLFPSSFAGDYLNKILRSAGRSPGKFFAKELGVTAGASIGGGIAEGIAPGNVPARIAGEVVGSVVNIPKAVGKLAFKVSGGIVSGLKRMSARGKNTEAAKIIQEWVAAGGEDPIKLATLAARGDLSSLGDAPLTVPQKTGSRALSLLRERLKLADPKSELQFETQVKEANEGAEKAIRALYETGDTEGFRAAAEIRAAQFSSHLRAIVKSAEKQMRQAVTQMSKDGPAQRADLSRRLEASMNLALRRGREAENLVWGKVDKTIKLPSTGADRTLASYAKALGDRVEDNPLPALVRGTIKKLSEAKTLVAEAADGAAVDPQALTKAQERLSVGNLLNFRSDLLDLSIKFASENKFKDARHVGELAEAVLADLSAVGVNTPGSPLDVARRFSREFNNTFTRTFVGQIEDIGRRGGAKVPPEIIMRKALASGQEMADLNFLQMQEASEFLIARKFGTPIDDQGAASMLAVQERMLRLMAARFVERDPLTNAPTKVNVSGLRQFLEEFGGEQGLLSRFPEVRTRAEELLKSEVARKALVSQVSRANTFFNQKSLAAKIFDVDNPVVLVRSMFKSNSPSKAFASAANTAKKSGPEAVRALRAMVYEDAFNSAKLPGGQLSLPDLVSALDDPVRPGSPNVVDIMEATGVLDKEGASFAKELVARVKRLVKSQGLRPVQGPDVGEIDDMLDLLIRGVGSLGGVRVLDRLRGLTGLPGGAGPSLIMARGGSKIAVKFMEKLPGESVQKIIAQALDGAPIAPGHPPGSLAALLLKKVGTLEEAEVAIRILNAYRVQAGIALAQYEIEGERE
ncbi:hypothetical protein COW64_17340 [bacterium (Candidatus Blackallbacteria) CG18_big_fil_WC_8_21_14_2_50_49_26]|nr:MAG: hypothetical protein COW64_17340 [bacterium (Candidatus Blackallbacteria) CG18_big_fil_WC_8_21_14_2_50_49_26]